MFAGCLSDSILWRRRKRDLSLCFK